MTVISSEYDNDQRWREWQVRNAEIDRKSTLQVRIVFSVIFVAVGARLALQLLST
jgi:hypothetical protein